MKTAASGPPRPAFAASMLPSLLALALLAAGSGCDCGGRPLEVTRPLLLARRPALGPLGDSPRAVATLSGKGGGSACDLQAASEVLDFGTVPVGASLQRAYIVENRGGGDCVLPRPAQIAPGEGGRFALVEAPAVGTVVREGQTATFTVSYAPQDEAGPDTAELSIPFADASSGAPVKQLETRLEGTPKVVDACRLDVVPGPTGTLGAELDFGEVAVGAERDLPVTFRDVGGAPCTLSNARIVGSGLQSSNDAPYFRVGSVLSTTLLPGESTVVTVAFMPDAVRWYGAPVPDSGSGVGVTLEVDTSDTSTFDGTACPAFGGVVTPGCTAWALSGEGVGSDLSALPSELDFGLVTTGCESEAQKVSLFNIGGAPTTIESVSIVPLGATPPGTFQLGPLSLPYALGPGGELTVRVSYHPTSDTADAANLEILSDATNVPASDPVLTVQLHGGGTSLASQTDTFTQAALTEADVLFMVDNSGSTEAEHGDLAKNAAQFLAVADEMGTDYHVAVITTDMDDPSQQGRFQGRPKIITPGPNAAVELSSTVTALGSAGSGTERGLAATYAALTDPLIDDPRANRGFLRPDARLAVIEVSDEDDQSDAPVDFYIDFFRTLKGPRGAGLVSVSAVVGDASSSGHLNAAGEPGCTSPYGDAKSGDRYLAVQQATGGQFRSICSADWGRLATDLGLDAFGARRGFPLSRAPIPSSIDVAVDGRAQRPSVDWTYDASSNAVVFSDNAIPKPGATIVVIYDTECHPG